MTISDPIRKDYGPRGCAGIVVLPAVALLLAVLFLVVG
jgi:hypothetical protein